MLLPIAAKATNIHPILPRVPSLSASCRCHYFCYSFLTWSRYGDDRYAVGMGLEDSIQAAADGTSTQNRQANVIRVALPLFRLLVVPLRRGSLLVIRSRWWLLLLVVAHLRPLLVRSWLLSVLALRRVVGILRRIIAALGLAVGSTALRRGSAVAGVGSLGRLGLVVWGWILLAVVHVV